LRESEPGRPIPYLDRVALEFPELRILGGHIGVPWLNEMFSLVMKYPNVVIDTSAYKVSRYPSELVEYMRGNKRHRVQESLHSQSAAFCQTCLNRSRLTKSLDLQFFEDREDG
jgi:hypothetical protein